MFFHYHKIFLPFSLFLVFCTGLNATNCISQKDGNWNDTSSWENNFLPQFSDTITIRHRIFHTNNLFLPSACYVLIEATGILCVSDTLFMPCSNIDTLFNHGNLLCKYFKGGGYIYNDGNMWFILGAHLGPACGHFQSIGAINYGTSKHCASDFPIPVIQNSEGDSLPPSNKKPDSTIVLRTHLEFYPNPVSDKLEMEFSISADEEVLIKISDEYGKRQYDLLDKFFKKGKYKMSFDTENHTLTPGFYIITLITAGEMISKKMIFID